MRRARSCPRDFQAEPLVRAALRARGLTAFAARLTLSVALSSVVLAGCFGATCPEGQLSICRDADDCRCGPACTVQRECTGRDACARYRDGRGGVCVDVLWLFGSEPPCVPLCNEGETCLRNAAGRSWCGEACVRNSDCAGCCVPLEGGASACAPADVCATVPCGGTCSTNEQCIDFGASYACSAACEGDDQCARSCCVPLSDGGGVCAPERSVYCSSTPAPGPCTRLDACVRTEAGATPGTVGTCGAGGDGRLYEGSVRNLCPEPAECVACWWSPATRAYTDCSRLDTLAPGATLPMGEARCSVEPPPAPPVRVRCVDQASAFGSNDCLSRADP